MRSPASRAAGAGGRLTVPLVAALSGLAAGCFLFPAAIKHETILTPVGGAGETGSGEERYAIQEDGSISWELSGLRVEVEHMTDEKLNRLFPDESSRGKYSTNPYTYGNWVDTRLGYTPNRFTVFKVTIFNRTFPKVLLDPLEAVVTTDQGQHLRAYGITSASPYENFENYYRSRRGQSGNEFYRFEVRLGTVRSHNYEENQAIFKGENYGGFIVFDPVYAESEEVILHLRNFVLRFGAFDIPEETRDLRFAFRHRVEQRLLEGKGAGPAATAAALMVSENGPFQILGNLPGDRTRDEAAIRAEVRRQLAEFGPLLRRAVRQRGGDPGARRRPLHHRRGRGGNRGFRDRVDGWQRLGGSLRGAGNRATGLPACRVPSGGGRSAGRSGPVPALDASAGSPAGGRDLPLRLLGSCRLGDMPGIRIIPIGLCLLCCVRPGGGAVVCSANECSQGRWPQTVYYRFSFNAAVAGGAVVRLTAVDAFEVFFGGESLGTGIDENWTTVEEYPVTLRRRGNHLAVQVDNSGRGQGSGLLVEITGPEGRVWASNTSGVSEPWLWTGEPQEEDGWRTSARLDEEVWRPVQRGQLDRSRLVGWSDDLGAEVIAGFPGGVDAGRPQGGLTLRTTFGENLAHEKPGLPDEVFDGDFATRWQVNPDALSASARVDLLQPRLIGEVRVITFGSDPG